MLLRIIRINLKRIFAFLIFNIPINYYTQDSTITENKQKKQSNIYFKYHFKEFDDTTLYKKSIEEIKRFSKFSRPPFNIKNATFYNPSLYFDRVDTLLSKDLVKIDALRYYIDTKSVILKENMAKVNTTLPYEYIYQPFYILNAEVTNAEYREFIHYVKDSIARRLLAESKLKNASEFGTYNELSSKIILNWNKKVPYDSDDDELRAVLQFLYLPEGERFYNRNEIDVRKINYNFWQIENQISHIINVYPDTLSWVHDIETKFGYCDLEPEANMYNWHYSYDNHPVVGISFIQVKAFLHWKTQKLQQEINRKGLQLLVEYDVPNEIELEMISLLKEKSKRVFSYNYKQRIENTFNYDLDLMLNYNKNYYCSSKKNIENDLNKKLSDNYCYKTRLLSYHVFPASSTVLPKKINSISIAYIDNLKKSSIIPFLNGNVSEWMAENLTNDDSISFSIKNGNNPKKWVNHLSNFSTTFPFKGNLEDSYILHKKLTNSYNDFQILKFNVIDSTFILNDVCKLVKGANWYDCGDWLTGHLKKTFLPKDSAYCTLGFRYVVRFKTLSK